MGLMFDDDNELKCPECGSIHFYEREEHTLDKIDKEVYTVYQETSVIYSLRCAQCNKLIDYSTSPNIQKLM